MYRQIFVGVQNLRYLGTLINLKKKIISEEIISRIAAGNGRFYSLRQIFRSRATSQSVKVKIHKTMVKAAALFGCETWAVNEMDLKRLGEWERKIYGPVVEQGMWRIETDQELRELYTDLDITADIMK